MNALPRRGFAVLVLVVLGGQARADLFDYVKAADAFGVEGEAVKEPGELKAAIGRAQHVIAEGRPYLLDVHTARDGIGATSTWHPPYSVAEMRSRRV